MTRWRRSLASCGLLWLLLGCSSTGVGNPAPAAVLSLAIVNDEAADIDPGDAGAEAGTAPGEAGSAGQSSMLGEAGAAANTDSGASAGGQTDAVAEAGAAGDSGSSSAQILPLRAVKDAIVVFGALHFLPCDVERGTPFAVSGPFVVDLKRKTTTPEIPAVQSTPGGYCGIDAPLAPADAPASLAGRSVFFDGYRADGTFFIVYANVTATLRMRAKPGATWQGQEPPPLFFWALRPRRWLLPIELNMVEAMPYDNHLRAVVIDANHHPSLFFAIRKRLAGVSTLYADANGDGVFDDPDRAAEVGEGLDNAD
jgi:hypothetical protein